MQLEYTATLIATTASKTPEKFLTKFKNQLPAIFPTEFLIETLEIVMKENIFQFGETFWLQLMGYAMGNSAAVN